MAFTDARPLFGREQERGRVGEVLARAGKGDGGALRIVGAAGVGKSTLLAAIRTDAVVAEMTVLETVGSPAEQLLPYAGLHRLLVPLLRGSAALPPAQRDALDAAFGRAESDRLPDPFLVGLATLELLADAATLRPVALVVDDWHWLDAPSADTLDFVARRVSREPIALVSAQRESFDRELGDGRTELPLDALEPDEAVFLLDHAHPGLDADVRGRVLAIAQGNPLALVELPDAMRVDGFDDGELPRLTSRLEHTFGERVATLPDETRLALLVAALQHTGTLDAIAEAAPLVGSGAWTAATLEPAAAAGLVAIDAGAVRFRHPLVRAAVVARADDASRRLVHDALAALAVEPDRAAWHRSADVTRPDEAFAAELEAAAEHAGARRDLALGHALFVRASRLSVDPAARAHRSVRAAELAFQLGRPVLVRPLLDAIRTGDLAPADRARLVALEMVSDDGVREGADAVRRFLAWASVAADAGEPGVAAALVLIAARNTYWTSTADELGDAILAAARAIDGDAATDLLLRVAEALVRPFTDGAAILPLIDVVAAGPLSDELTVLLAMAAYVVGDFDRSLSLAQRAAVGLHRDGHHALLVWARVLETFCGLFLGRWEIATVAGDQTARLAVETRQPVWAAGASLAQGMLAALQGDRDTAVRITADVERTALVTGNASLLSSVQMMRGLAALGSQRPEEAWHELRRMQDPDDPAFQSPQFAWAIDYLAEAAAGCGRQDECRELIDATAHRVAGSQAPVVLRSLALARLFVADDDEVPDALAAATHLPTTPWHRARRDLAHGKWLRRHRDIAGARRVLASAGTTFAALGASAWADAAERELAAAGVTARQRAEPDAWARLSAQELQVALLAAQGLSNREIAARLFLSHRTVAAHLYRGFPKLGITSRNQLHLVLPIGADGLTS